MPTLISSIHSPTTVTFSAIALHCIASIGNPDGEMTCPQPDSLHPGCAWPPRKHFGRLSEYPSVLWWGVVVYRSNTRSQGLCVPKMVAQLRGGWISSIILRPRCRIVLCHMWGIASPHSVIYSWNNLVLSLPCVASGRALGPIHTG